MRRLLLSALAALVLLPAVSGARILVVVDRLNINASGGAEPFPSNETYEIMQNRLIGACLDILNTTGASYDMIPITSMQNKWLKDGKRVLSYRSSGGVGVDSVMTKYDGVIMLNDALKFAASSVTGKRPWPPSQIGCYTCSLTTNPNFYPRVPILTIWGANNGSSTVFGTGGSVYAPVRIGSSTATCSLGVALGSTGVKSAMPMLSYSTNNRNAMWFSAANKFVGNALSGGNLVMGTASGGVRALLGRHDPAFRAYTTGAFTGTRPILNRMDAPVDAGADTVDVWERLFTGFAGTTYGGVAIPSNARLIVANVMGASPCSDSLASVSSWGVNIPCEFDAPTFLFALAHLDSLTGGKVWEAATSRLPLKAGVVIVGGFTRNPRGWSLGFDDADSVGIKATMDSLNTLGIPITVGVNVDSLSNYPWERAWWNRIGNVQFTPQAWTGIADRYLQVTNNQPPTNDSTNAAGNGAWSQSRPVDVFGRFRNRAFFGDSTIHTYTSGGADSSIYYSLRIMRSTVNDWWPNKVSNTLVAPLDDYSPKKMDNGFAKSLDSLVYVVKLAGFKSILTNVQYLNSDPARWRGTRGLLRGGVPKQGPVRDAIGGGDPLYFIGTNGHHNAGARYQYLHGMPQAMDTSVTEQEVYGGAYQSSPSIPTSYMSRFWAGFVHDEFVDPDYFTQNQGFMDVGWSLFIAGIALPMEDHFGPMRRGNVLRITATELSGNPSASAISRPGFWTIKSLVNSFSAINAAAGRTVCSFDWPENIRPTPSSGAAITTTLSLLSSLNPSTSGTSVTFILSATPVNGAYPTGSVVFKSDGTQIGSTQTLSNGSASVSTSALAVGSHTITATFIPTSSGPTMTVALAQAEVVN